ncbi:hypothetical protein [Chlorobium phaeobacteroides]|uniref:hypothetical protein n=1 Tax=Chlorobium phaeobacteroides TaxID=1096 RepID=UPI001232B7A4|nr:hypothetical protein [Chlorobium phaeobacteroides]
MSLMIILLIFVIFFTACHLYRFALYPKGGASGMHGDTILLVYVFNAAMNDRSHPPRTIVAMPDVFRQDAFDLREACW